VNWNSETMSCDDVRAAIADRVFEGTALSAAIEAHIAGCEACRAYRDETKQLWADLGELTTPGPRLGGHRRLENALAAQSSRDVPVWTRRLLMAAGFVLAMVVGYGVASWRAAPKAPVGQQYLLLLYDTDAMSHLPPAAASSLVAEYAAWARGLRSRGHQITGEKLSDAPSEWYGGVEPPTGGERLGGFFLIRAGSAEEAKEIASDCPHVRHGGRLELRAIDKT
jgi:hypothetical protein